LRGASGLLGCHTRAFVDDRNGPLELRADVLGPSLTAGAAAIAVDYHRGPGAR